MSLRARFWIRKDREDYFLGGVIIACCIGGFVSSYWHFSDRIAVRRKIDLKTQVTPETGQKKLRDVQFTPSQRGKQYYKMDQGFIPSVPKPGEDQEPAAQPAGEADEGN